MHPVQIPVCAAILLLATPAFAQSANDAPARVGGQSMSCADMHAKMRGNMMQNAMPQTPSDGVQTGMTKDKMHAMKCMHEGKSKAPPASQDEANAPRPEHDHDHGDAQPRR